MDEELDLPKRVLYDWKKLALYVLPAAIVAGILVAKLGTKKGRAEGDYVSATAAFTKWDQILDQKSDEFASLERLVKKYPELHAHYDAPIGQNLLAFIAPDKAAPYVERTLKRTNQPYYSDYARTSLKISEGNYAEALEEASSLREKIIEDPKDHSVLLAFNLMRIATLSRELNNHERELEAWREIKRYGGWEEGIRNPEIVKHEGFKELQKHFSVQETTLLDYIQAREEVLRKS